MLKIFTLNNIIVTSLMKQRQNLPLSHKEPVYPGWQTHFSESSIQIPWSHGHEFKQIIFSSAGHNSEQFGPKKDWFKFLVVQSVLRFVSWKVQIRKLTSPSICTSAFAIYWITCGISLALAFLRTVHSIETLKITDLKMN